MDRQGAPGLLIFEGLHAAFDMSGASLLVGFEIEPSVHQDGKETVRLIQTIAAEHRLGADFRECVELVEDKLFERLIRHAGSMPRARVESQPAFKFHQGRAIPANSAGCSRASMETCKMPP